MAAGFCLLGVFVLWTKMLTGKNPLINETIIGRWGQIVVVVVLCVSVFGFFLFCFVFALHCEEGRGNAEEKGSAQNEMRGLWLGYRDIDCQSETIESIINQISLPLFYGHQWRKALDWYLSISGRLWRPEINANHLLQCTIRKKQLRDILFLQADGSWLVSDLSFPSSVLSSTATLQFTNSKFSVFCYRKQNIFAIDTHTTQTKWNHSSLCVDSSQCTGAFFCVRIIVFSGERNKRILCSMPWCNGWNDECKHGNDAKGVSTSIKANQIALCRVGNQAM